MRTIVAISGVIVMLACVGTTGGELVDFPAAAAGASDVTSPLAFDETTIAGHTWHVTLTKATLHIGAMYLDQALPVSGAQITNCILPGTYVGEVLDGLDVDLLSSAAQSFPSFGHGTTTQSLVGQVWLTGGDVDTIADATPILIIAGTATDDAGANVPFDGTITIGSNREPQNSTPAGANPICKQRIVSSIPTTATPATTGGLLLRIDARRLFDDVDFAELSAATFSDDPTAPDYTQPSANLYANLHAYGPYTFSWEPSL